MQDDYDCYFIIANIQAFTTRMDRPDEVHHNVMEDVAGLFSGGNRSEKKYHLYSIQIPAIAELTVFFSMLVPYARVMRNPTIKDEIRDKGLGDNYPFGFSCIPSAKSPIF